MSKRAAFLSFLIFQMSNLMAAGVLFDERDRAIFAQQQALIFEKYTYFFEDKEINKASFDKLYITLAIERRKIAELCADGKSPEDIQEAKLFGSLRTQNGPTGNPNIYYTPLIPAENQALYAIYNAEFIAWLKTNKSKRSRQIFSKSYGNSLLSEYEMAPGGLRSTHASEIFAAQLRSCPQRSLKKLEALYKKGQIGQIKFAETVVLEGNEIPISSICGLIEMEPDLSIPERAISGLENDAGYLIDHAPSTSIDPLMNQAFVHWQNAMLTSPQWTKGPFLKEIAWNYWYVLQVNSFVRGSEAHAKWMIELVVRHHGFALSYVKDFVCRMPFAQSKDDFYRYFMLNTEIEPLDYVENAVESAITESGRKHAECLIT